MRYRSLQAIYYRQELDQSKIQFLLHLLCLPFVCIIGIYIYIFFPCNRFLFSQVNVTFSNTFFLDQFLLVFFQFEPHARNLNRYSHQANFVLVLSSKNNKDHCVRSNCPLVLLGNLSRLHFVHYLIVVESEKYFPSAFKENNVATVVAKLVPLFFQKCTCVFLSYALSNWQVSECDRYL